MSSFLRPSVLAMKGYTPGEQPQSGPIIKLNTNENPYPPSPKVFEAIQAALTGERLRKYPDPMGRQFRETAAPILGVPPDAILIGNGSDEVLTLITRAIVPEGGILAAPTPSYLLYRTLAEQQGARYSEIPFHHWRLDPKDLPPETNLTFVPNPNSPTGTWFEPGELLHWPTPLVIDEAYVDFAEGHALPLIQKSDRILVTRSFSKSYSLAGIRFGLAVGNPELIAQLYKLKDSYNCDVLSQAAATAAIADQAYLHTCVQRIRSTRKRMEKELTQLGFQVIPSQANFVWCQHQQQAAHPLYEQLKNRGILVRYMNYAGFGDGLRISVGLDEQIDLLLATLRQLV